MSEIFDDTMKGLMEAIAIEKGEIDLINVPNMPGDTYRSCAAGILRKYADASLYSKEKAAYIIEI